MDTFADLTEEVNKIHSPIKEECFQLLSNFDVEFDTDFTKHYPITVTDSSEQSVKYAVESLWCTLLSNIKSYPSPIKHTHREKVGKIIFKSANRFSCVNTCYFDKLIYCFKSPGGGLAAEINFRVVKY